MATKTQYKPLFDNVLIKPVQADTKSAGGIYLPENVKEKPQLGEVVAVGPGKTHPHGEVTKMVVKVGDKVLYTKWGGNEVKVGNEEWKIVKQDDILAIIG
ncbi:MAG TPA: co-chaperone GroES [Candidatus Saccharimonadales bacterium]|nr:co-chaperone GroES [Candidatus Saccharimonadales bacterium]